MSSEIPNVSKLVLTFGPTTETALFAITAGLFWVKLEFVSSIPTLSSVPFDKNTLFAIIRSTPDIWESLTAVNTILEESVLNELLLICNPEIFDNSKAVVPKS